MMALRPSFTMLRSITRTRPFLLLQTSRNFQTSGRLMESPSRALPVRKPIGAFRGGLFGFLLGATLAGGSIYYYILGEYKVSNELLTEDIYAMQAATQRLNEHVKVLEDKLETMDRKKK